MDVPRRGRVPMITRFQETIEIPQIVFREGRRCRYSQARARSDGDQGPMTIEVPRVEYVERVVVVAVPMANQRVEDHRGAAGEVRGACRRGASQEAVPDPHGDQDPADRRGSSYLVC